MEIILIGNGGHSRVIQEAIRMTESLTLIAVLDDKYNQEFVENGMIHGPVSLLKTVIRKDVKVLVAIGDNKIRKKVVSQLNLLQKQFLSIIHPSAIISTSASIGYGTVIMPNAVVNAGSQIGDHCIINTSAVIEHDNIIGDYSHISPGASLTGNVTTDEGVHVGASSTVIPGKHLGGWSIIGAGSTVIENIPAYSKAVGTPTRIIERILI